MEIFGKSGRDVIGMLSDFKAKADEARAFNDKFNISFSEVDGAKVEAANDSFARLGRVLGGVGNTVAIEVSPIITELSKDILDVIPSFDKMGSYISATIDGIAFLLDRLVISIRQVKFAFSEGVPAIGASLYAKMTGEDDVGMIIATNLKNNLNETKKSLGEDFNKIQTWVKDARAKADADAKTTVAKNKSLGGIDSLGADSIDAALARQKKLLKDITGPALELEQTLADLDTLYRGGSISASQYSDAVDKIRLQLAELDKSASGGFMAGLLKVKKEFSDLGNLAENAVTNGFKSAEDAIVEFAKSGKLSVKGMVDSIVSDLIRLQVRQSITGPLFSAIAGSAAGGGSLLGNLFSSFTGFHADGGFIGPGKWGIAGEAGAEAIFGGTTGATVVPMTGGGGGVNVTVINNTGAQVNATSNKNSSGGFDLKLMIDQAVAGLMSDPGSSISRANRLNGVNSPLTKR